MSALLMLFYWVGLPYLGFCLTQFLSQRASSWRKKAVCWLGYCSYIAFFLWIAVGRSMWLDARMQKMEDENGGIHVYETVALTPDLLDKKGRIHIPSKDRIKPDDKYYYDTIHETIWSSITHSVEIRKSRICVIRVSDNKLLGEQVMYLRRGSGLWSPYHPPTVYPKRKRNRYDSIEDHVFVKQDG